MHFTLALLERVVLGLTERDHPTWALSLQKTALVEPHRLSGGGVGEPSCPMPPAQVQKPARAWCFYVMAVMGPWQLTQPESQATTCPSTSLAHGGLGRLPAWRPPGSQTSYMVADFQR